MESYLIGRYGGAVPRYTSYPTAPHFGDGVRAGTYADWLGRLGDGQTLSLYFHVPFCARMCWYCGCHTKIARRYEPIGEYAVLLGAELDLIADAMSAAPRVIHIHWGGGTPTMLAPDDFRRLMDHARRRFRFAEAAEIAVEIDPRTLAADKIAALAGAGVSRASLGVQEFSESIQRAINRIQPYEMVAEAVAALRGAGIGAINFDLMYGLPGQGVADVVRSAELAADLGPDRIALFGYAHVPWIKKHQRLIDEAALPLAEARLEQAEAGAECLVARGYRRIGLDHFALPDDPLSLALDRGTLKRNFQGYTTDSADALLGLGASAIGALPQGYVQNAVPLDAYGRAIGAGRLAVVRGLAVGDDDCRRRAVIERLMCDLGVDLAALGRDEADFADELAGLRDMAADGLVELSGSRIRVTERGRPFVRSICARFDAYLGHGKARHSAAV